jgi:hypothetical protein
MKQPKSLVKNMGMIMELREKLLAIGRKLLASSHNKVEEFIKSGF